MRTFNLTAVEVTEGQWEMKWGSDGGVVSLPEMHWIITIVAQVILDKAKGPPIGAQGGLILPSQN